MAIGLPLRKYLEDDDLKIPDDIFEPKDPVPVERNDIYWMLGHKLRVTTVKATNKFYDGKRERRVFLTCADDCNCGFQFCDRLVWPVKLQILERHLHKIPLDKLRSRAYDPLKYGD